MAWNARVFVIAQCLLISWQALAAVSGRIDFTDTSHDFGEINRGDIVTHEFGFKNGGDADLVVKGVHAACGCTVAEFANDKVYKPGEVGTIKVSFDSKNFSGVVVKSVAIMTNEAAKPGRNLTIKARVNTDVVLNPPLVNFGEARNGSFSEQVVKVVTHGATVPLKLEFNPQVVQAELRGSGNAWTIHVNVIAQNAPVGHLRERIYLLTSSKHLPKVEVPVRADVLGSFKVTPGYVEFGNVAANATVERVITIEYLANETIRKATGELNLNGKLVERPQEMLTLNPSDDGKKMVAVLNNNRNLNGSVHGKIIMQTSDPAQKQLSVDFYAFFGNVK